ncbi:MAG: sulfatase [Myxococcota bacterium]|nr:sulfatase [Myxococcota bacterium]
MRSKEFPVRFIVGFNSQTKSIRQTIDMLINLMLFFLLSCSSIPRGDAERPDIVLISIDTLRADHLSCYGYERDTTPFIDSLAADSILFERAFSTSSWTLPAHTTIMTGYPSLSHRIVDEQFSIPADQPRIATALQTSGWATGAVVSASFVSRLYGFDRGFDFFEDFGLNGDNKRNLDAEIDAEDIVDRALQWYQTLPPKQSAFLFLHFYDAHYTCDPPSPHSTRYDPPLSPDAPRYKSYPHYQKNPLSAEELTHQINQYDESIHYVDTQIKRLFTQLQQADRSVRWIITSDHGEEFGERGSWGHGHTLFKEQLHIPLIVSAPASKREKTLVGLHDIAPTIAQWAGVPWTSEGISLLGDIPQRSILSETSRFSANRLSLTTASHRLDWDVHNDTVLLFDHERDFSERSATSNSARSNELKQALISELGQPWIANTSGLLRASKGKILFQNTLRTELDLKEGMRWQAIPFDTRLRLGTDATYYTAIGNKVPTQSSPIQVSTTHQTSDVELSPALKEHLKQLGYISD